MDEKRLEALRSTIHPLLSILTPYIVLMAVDGLLRALFFDDLVGVPPVGYRLVILAAGVVEALSANALLKARATGFGPRFREAVLLFAALGLVLHLSSGTPFQGRFDLVAPGAVWALFLAAVQWALSLTMHRVLIARELFLSLLVGKPEGRAMANAAREAGGEATLLQEGFAKIRFGVCLGMAVLFLTLFIGLITGTSSGGTLGTGLLLYAAAVLAVDTGLLAFLRHAESEHDAYSDGLPIPRAMRLGRLKGLLAILAVLLCAAFLMAGSHALLPVSKLAEFFEWLGRLLTPPVSEAKRPPLPKTRESGGNDGGMMGALAALGQRQDNPLLASIVKAVGIALAVALALAFLFFLIRPLLSRDTRAAIRAARPLAFLARKARALLSCMRRAASGFAGLLRSPRTRAASPARAAFQGMREAAARRRAGAQAAGPRSRETGRAVREFLRLIRWGRRSGVDFRGALGPAAYAAALAAAVPRAGEGLASAAALFEELVYSPRGDDPALMTALSRTVSGIVRMKPERKGNGR